MNSAADPGAAAQIEGLRALGAAQREPLRWAYVEALARRRESLPGRARTRLDERLARALEDCRRALATAAASSPAPDPGPGPLAGLTARLAPIDAGDRPPELRSVARFRGEWERLGVEQRLAGAPAAQPVQAGPLNSEGLVSRALALMQEVSPRYLRHFVAHVDALMWLESALAGPPPRGAEAPAAARAKPGAKRAAPGRGPATKRPRGQAATRGGAIG